MRHQENPRQKLEQALTGLRLDQPEPEVVQAAGERVWRHLRETASHESPLLNADAHAASIHGCNDVKALLPQYREGRLSASRALLVRDHLRECVACRKEAAAQEDAKTNSGAASAVLLPWSRELPKPRQNHFRWMATAAAVLVACASLFLLWQRLAVPAGPRARVESVNGFLYRVSWTGEQPLRVGDELGEGERVRTPGGSRAMMLLADGSRVEMNERAEFSVALRRKDTTIRLDRGDIIVQAAKRRSGHLYVAAKDCLVSVTGTVFSVDSGMKGSRVSVIEGEVRVAEAGATSILHPGDQLSTSPGMDAVPVTEEIAWSGNRDQHLALLAEFAHLQNKLAAVPSPGLRFDSRLLPLLPASTVLYAGAPNYSDAIQKASELFQQELQESPVLREWWEQQSKAGDASKLQEAVERVHQLGQYLGNEIVFSVAPSADGEYLGAPLIVAEVGKPGLKEFMLQQLAQAHPGRKDAARVFDEKELAQAQIPPGTKEFMMLVRPGLVAVAFDLATLKNFEARIQQQEAQQQGAQQGVPQGGGFAATPFGQRMVQAYSGGVELLFGANLQELQSRLAHGRAQAGRTMERSGFADAQFLVAERKEVAGQVLNHAELAFSGPRHGVASWLAAPASIGGLDFVSPQAGAVLALITKNPASMLDDLTALRASSGEEREDGETAGLESEMKIRLRDGLAGALGGEVTVALDGPILPSPSWKVVAEVNDPARLQQTLQQLVSAAQAHGKPGDAVTLEEQSQGGVDFHTLRHAHQGKTVEIDYAFADGYLVAAPSRALVMEALRIHQSGDSLAKSAAFQSLLPKDRFTNVSAVLYQNLAPVIAPVAQQLTQSQLQSLGQLAADAKPSLICAYGGENDIQAASNSRFFGLDLNTLALSSLLKLNRK